MMDADKSRLLNILDRTKDISRFISGCSQEAFIENDEKQNAVVMCLLRIGENANRLSAEFIAANSQVSWRPIINLRHIAAHKYDSLQMLDVWVNATVDVPISNTNLRSTDVERYTPKFLKNWETQLFQKLAGVGSRRLIPTCNCLIACWYKSQNRKHP